MFAKLTSIFKRNECTPEFWEELEEALLLADVGVTLTDEWLSSLRSIKRMDEVRETLRKKMMAELIAFERHEVAKPRVVMVVGVNGVGKTTTIAKLARIMGEDAKKVQLVAADTFRAAAVAQLTVWAERLGVPLVAQGMGADPAAVAFDGVVSGVAREMDVVLVDTAGRLHNKAHLMDELKKVKRVMGKAMNESPHDVWMVLDATTGQNGLEQAKEYHEALGLTGVIVTKMDGTSKGGIIFQIARRYGLPIVYVGTGEKAEDIALFDRAAFVEGIV